MKEDLKLKTLIHLYFGKDSNHKRNAIFRAYRDFNRTLELGKESKSNRERKKNQIADYLEVELSKLLLKRFKNQTEFDSFHHDLSNQIKNKWEILSFGQIQKWINMTLKYWLIIGKYDIPGIEKNYDYFHIPIDRIIKEKIFRENKNKSPWSKITDYSVYFKYQQEFRKSNPSEIPIIFESDIFIKHIKS
jgi:hypothetical protein